MNLDATPMNPFSYSASFYKTLPEHGNLKEIFRFYGMSCFRNGFAVGFATGSASALFLVLLNRIRS